MELKIALQDKKFDLRIRDRVIAEGKLSKEEADSFEAGLEDSEFNVSFVEDDSKESRTQFE